MKVAFWSNSNELCGVSANLAAVSVISAIRYSCSIITLENRLSHQNLGVAYNGGSYTDVLHEAGTNYYDGSGIEGLLRKIYRGDLSPGGLMVYLKEIIQGRLYYLPQSRVIHNEIFDYELDRCIRPLFQILEKNSELCFIDTASNHSLSTRIILEEAELIVVNLCQKSAILEDFFLNHSSLISKSIFLISNYEHHSLYNMRQIAKLLQVPSEQIIPIPVNEGYRAAYRGGYVYEYISRNLGCARESGDYIFIQSVKRAAYLIMKKAKSMPGCAMPRSCAR